MGDRPMKRAKPDKGGASVPSSVAVHRSGRGSQARAEIEAVIESVEAMRVKQGYASSQEEVSREEL